MRFLYVCTKLYVQVLTGSIKTDKNDAVQFRSSEELFQGPIHGTPLGTALKRITHSKAAPDGLKSPILYIQEKDELQEAVDATANTIKLTLPDKLELQVSMWSCSTVLLSSSSCTSNKQAMPSSRRAQGQLHGACCDQEGVCK